MEDFTALDDPALLNAVRFARVFDHDILIPYSPDLETEPANLDPLASFTQGLEFLEPDLAAAYPSPPYESDSPTMTSPSYSCSNLDDDYLDIGSILSDDVLLSNVVLADINDNLESQSNVERQETLSNVSEIDLPVAAIMIMPKDEDSNKQNKPVSQYTLRSRAPSTLESSGKKEPFFFDSIGQTVFNKRKRARDVSPDVSQDFDQDSETDKSNRAAMQARINRQKKKAFIHGLESQATELSEENCELKRENNKLTKEKKSLLQERALSARRRRMTRWHPRVLPKTRGY